MTATETRTLTAGEKYDVSALEFTGWTGGENADTTGYNTADYFDRDGRYLGPDCHGVEPTFATE